MRKRRARRSRWWWRIVIKDMKTRSEIIRSRRPGRFHDDPLAQPTCYGADSLETAWRETCARYVVPLDPRGFRAYRIGVRGKLRLVDLSTEPGRRKWGIKAADVTGDPATPVCGAIAATIRGAGYHGLVYPSVRNRPKGQCVALFLENLGDKLVVQRAAARAWKRFVSSL